VKKGIIAWKLLKIGLAATIVVSVSVFSLKKRVEIEHGPGSWDHWIRATPEVDDYQAEQMSDLRPKNLKARFWTGVPRSRDSSVVRIDRTGYSVGLSTESGKTAWLATYLPGKATSEVPPATLRRWESEKYKPESEAEGLSLEKDEMWVHYIPPALMREYYGHDADVWMGGNRFPATEKFATDVWAKNMRVVDKYARMYAGLVVFVVPLYARGTASPEEVAIVMIRPSANGPVAMCVSVKNTATTIPPQWSLKSISELEQETGVFLFADLPEEWRKFLLHSSQNKAWLLPE